MLIHYLGLGHPNLWLKNGFRRRPISGHPRKWRIEVVDEDQLVKLLAQNLIHKPGRLCGAEFRIARMASGLSQRQLGAVIGKTEQSISLWERFDGVPIYADLVCRALLKEQLGMPANLMNLSETISEHSKATPAHLVAEMRPKNHWIASCSVLL